MRTSSIFAAKGAHDVADLVRKHPLGWIVSAVNDDIEATPLPLIADLNEQGRVHTLIGHFARANRHVDMLRQNGRAIVIFHGEHGYVSPSWMVDRKQAPTWNFETVHFVVDIAFMEQEEQTADAIEQLLEAMEENRANRWRSHELDERYPRLLKAVVGFRATVVETRVKFKLGQNERPDVYRDIVAGLSKDGNEALARAMESFNSQ